MFPFKGESCQCNYYIKVKVTSLAQYQARSVDTIWFWAYVSLTISRTARLACIVSESPKKAFILLMTVNRKMDVMWIALSALGRQRSPLWYYEQAYYQVRYSRPITKKK